MPRKDLNLVKENQNLLCYRYTTGQKTGRYLNQTLPDARGGTNFSPTHDVLLMNWKILAVGKPALPWARQGIDDYLGRCGHYAKVDVEYLKDGPRAQLEERFLKSSEGSRRIVLDERGKRLTTGEWHTAVDRWELAGTKRVTLLIGGADGHSAALRESADEVWSLSALTLQHELALVVLLEQLYRVYTIKRGEPYHR